MRHTVHTRALQRAAEILGGVDALGAFLEVPKRRLDLWMGGQIGLPGDVFLQVVDILLEHQQGEVLQQRDAERPGG